MGKYHVEVTDTFGGEPNYCWVKSFIVSASSPQGAITKVAKETGYRFRKDWDYGDFVRYNAQGACVCASVEYFDPNIHKGKDL